MTLKTEGFHAGHFLVSEAEGTRSRDVVTIAHGEVLAAGSVLAKNSSTGKYTHYNNDTTPINAAVGILFANVDATAGDVKAVMIARDAEVNLSELQWAATEDTGDRDAAIADLKLLHIIAR